MVENPIFGPKFEAFFYAQFHVTDSIFPYNKLVDCLPLWNELKMNITLDIDESDEHCLHLSFRHASFVESRGYLPVVSTANFLVCFCDHTERTMFYLRL